MVTDSPSHTHRGEYAARPQGCGTQHLNNLHCAGGSAHLTNFICNIRTLKFRNSSTFWSSQCFDVTSLNSGKQPAAKVIVLPTQEKYRFRRCNAQQQRNKTHQRLYQNDLSSTKIWDQKNHFVWKKGTKFWYQNM